VACLFIDRLKSSGVIPVPLSVIWIKELPPSFYDYLDFIGFGINCVFNQLFYRDAGRSITSPAAI
jgi:hypothetical protein